MPNIILLGKIGAGKSTLSKQLEPSGFTTITPGNLYRKEYEQKTEFGLRAYSYWGDGNLCPDEMTNELMQKTIKSLCTTNIIFDGYPRTVVQAKFLDSIIKIHLILDLHINDDVSVKRLLRRREIENRPDDTEEIIRQRLIVYHKNNDAIVNYYSSDLGRYRLVDTDKPKIEAYNEIQAVILKREMEI